LKKFSEKLSWRRAAFLLKGGAVGVLPTDTIYGICGSALNKKSVEQIYRLRKRNPKKPVIVLVSSLADLKKFGVAPEKWQKEILQKIWPGKVSAVLPCLSKNFFYLHRGTKTVAFRLPAKKTLIKLLSVSGPLAAPSANPEGRRPARNISDAKKYFSSQVFYYGAGTLKGRPSALIDITVKPFKILRQGPPSAGRRFDLQKLSVRRA